MRRAMNNHSQTSAWVFVHGIVSYRYYTYNHVGKGSCLSLHSSILTCKCGIGAKRRWRVINRRIWVGPGALLKAVDVIAQDIKVGIEDEGIAFEIRIIDCRTFEQLDREAGKDHVRTVHLGGKAAKLVDLRRAEVGLHIALEVLNKLRNGWHNCRAEQFFAQGTHDDILILGASKDVVLTDACNPKGGLTVK